jgi:hypothetical protein
MVSYVDMVGEDTRQVLGTKPWCQQQVKQCLCSDVAWNT